MRIKILFLLFSIFLGCSTNRQKKEIIIIKGSDTMINLTRLWAEEYMKINQKVSIQVTGGGSGTGIASLLNGTGDIANISRELKTSELANAKKLNITPVKHIVALDAIAIVVNPANKINNLSIKQLRDIFSGAIKNWKELGGPDAEIVLFGRENSSGTYEFVKETILNDKENHKFYDFSPSTLVLQGTSSLAESIVNEKYSIGYGSVGYFVKRNDIKIIAINHNNIITSAKINNSGDINYKDIWSGLYPLSRYLYCYVNGESKPEVKNYLKFIKSKNGQKLVKQMEYIPLPTIN